MWLNITSCLASRLIGVVKVLVSCWILGPRWFGVGAVSNCSGAGADSVVAHCICRRGHYGTTIVFKGAQLGFQFAHFSYLRPPKLIMCIPNVLSSSSLF